METFYRQQESELDQTMQVRRDWEQATEQTRRLAMAVDSEIRRRRPSQRFEPLRSAEPAVTDAESERLILAPGTLAYHKPEWPRVAMGAWPGGRAVALCGPVLSGFTAS
jgi:hypothetical protein